MSWNDCLLLAAPALPLLLAIPVLRRFIPGFQYLAIAPAFLLLFVSDDQVVELPWLLLGTVFVSSSETQLLLLLAVMIWVPAMMILSTTISTDDDSYISNRHYTFYLLTLGGYLGTILAADVVGFFTFSTLAGYSFYGLLDIGGDIDKRARRVYLYFIIAADLLLFEALLIIASATEQLDYDSVREAIAGSTFSQMYVAIVLLGFSLKAGFWPLHLWLLLAFRSVRMPTVILLAGVPVTIGLLGIVRWLPMGEITLPTMGMIIQALGGIALLYAIFSGLIWRQLNVIPAYVTIFVTGWFNIALGAGLRNAAVWGQYAHLIPIYIIILGGGLAFLTIGIHRYLAGNSSQANQQKQSDKISRWFEGWSNIIVHHCNVIGLESLPRLRTSCLATIESIMQIDVWKKALQTGENFLQHWSLAVALFLLLVITIVLVAVI